MEPWGLICNVIVNQPRGPIDVSCCYSIATASGVNPGTKTHLFVDNWTMISGCVFLKFVQIGKHSEWGRDLSRHDKGTDITLIYLNCDIIHQRIEGISDSLNPIRTRCKYESDVGRGLTCLWWSMVGGGRGVKSLPARNYFQTSPWEP